MRFVLASTYRRTLVLSAAIGALGSMGLVATPAAIASPAAGAHASGASPQSGPTPPPRPAPVVQRDPAGYRPDPVTRQPVSGPSAPVPSGSWQPLGPAPINSTPSNAFSGRITGLVVIPTSDSTHPGRIVVGSAGGGIWTSDNGGTTWTSRTDNAADLAIGSLAEDPSNPEHLVAGTGEENNCGDCAYGDGILDSTDGGTTWTLQNPGGVFNGTHIGQVAITPGSSGQHEFAATDNGLFVTTNGGTNWAKPSDATYGSSLNGEVTSVVIDPTTPTNVYIGTEASGLVGKSVDGGSTWTVANANLASGSYGLVELAIAPSAPSTLYVALGNFDQVTAVKLYVTTNSAASWSAVPNTPDYTGQTFYYHGGTDDQGWYDNAIAVDPGNAGHIVVGGIGIAEATGATGATPSWTSMDYTVLQHPDQHALAFTASGDLWIGNDGGVYHRTHGTSTISPANGNLNITQLYYGFNVVGTTVLAGSQDNSTVVTSSTTQSPWTQVYGGDGGPSFTTPNDTTLQFFQSDKDVLVSTDGLSTWNDITPPATNGIFTPPLTVVPNSGTPSAPTVLYGAANLWRTTDPTDATPSWTQVTSVASSMVTAIAAAPSNPQVVYVGFRNGTIEVSTDNGVTWSALAADSGTPEKWVTGISVDPTNPQSITASYSYTYTRSFSDFPHVDQYTYTTSASTGTWTTITGSGLPNAVSRVVYDNGALLAATDSGVYSTGSVNGSSTTWSRVGSGLPNVQCQDIFVASDGTPYVVTHGRGAWKLVVTPSVTAVSPSSGPATGGTNITITGTGFASGDTVVIGQGNGSGTGAISATNVTVVDSSHITATTGGGGKSGQWNVFVLDNAHNLISAPNTGGYFTYNVAVSGVSPSSGPATGGTSITITGAGFAAGDTVVIGQGNGSGTGAIAATNVTVVDTTHITATTGGGAKAGPWNVFVTDHAHNVVSAPNTGGTFTYNIAVSGVSPSSGPRSGGTSITITGAGFAPGDTVVIGQGNGSGTGSIAATNVTVVDSTHITATTGGGANAGQWNVFVIDHVHNVVSAPNTGGYFTYT